jgi:hypothetical protein
MGADDAIARFRQRAAAEHEGDQRSAATQHVMAAAGGQLPALALLQPRETLRPEALLDARHGMPGAGAGIDEGDQVLQLPNVTDLEFEASLAELRDLAKTLGYEVTATFTQKRSSFDATAYLGTGKREEIRAFVDSEPAPGAFEKPQHAAADPEAGRIEAISSTTRSRPRRRATWKRRSAAR